MQKVLILLRLPNKLGLHFAQKMFNRCNSLRTYQIMNLKKHLGVNSHRASNALLLLANTDRISSF